MQLKDVSLSFGLQEVFDCVNVEIKSKSKIGIVGVNGAGKSTLFKLLLGILKPDKGSIIFGEKARVGYLPQVISDDVENMDMLVFDYLLEGRPIKKLESDLEKLYEEAGSIVDDRKLNEVLKKISKVQAELEYYEEFNAENILLKIVSGMGIDDNLLDMKLKNLSGGQKSKVAFARLLYSNPEILLLDEPTNHLDLDSKEYIINYLKNYNGMVLVISHDEEFLDLVTNETLYIDKLTHKMELFRGSYSKYLKIRDERLKTKERLYEKQVKEEEKLKRIIAKYINGNEKKANIAKDRIKKLERLEKEKVTLDKKMKRTNFKIKINRESNSVPLRVNNLTFGYREDNILINDLTFDIARGEKFLVVGENGVGKSTLLKLIIGLLKPLNGEVDVNVKTDMAYYAQEHEMLNNELNVLDNFKEYDGSVNGLRALLGNFLFFGDDVYKKVGVLSPGERSRVALAKIAISGANFLLLDEPTNHLDPQTQKLIAETFKSYEGTLLVVSHNLEFVDNLGVERMLMLPSGQIRYYDKEIVKFYEEINKN